MPLSRRICVLGHHELDYPRNVVNQRLIRKAGWEIELVHSRAAGPLREAELVRGYARVMRETDAVFVTEGSHRHVPLIKAAAAFAGRELVFDPFTSRYGTYVEDRGWYRPGSLQALRCHLLDWTSTRAADHCVFDTHEHREYFERRYGVRKSTHVIEVGVDEEVFRPGPGGAGGREGELSVLFYGTYIPLQGVEHIVEAAALVGGGAGIRFTLIGAGQTRPAIERRLAELGLAHVELEDAVPPAELVERMRRADVCLGIFGDTTKAGNVVPNKVVQAAAVGRPLVTRRSRAVERYFRAGEDALLVDPADPRGLAEALRALRDAPRRRAELAAAGRAVFERHFAEAVLTRKMGEVLEAATRRRK